jgi:glycosyltransferase involved in cell wall biosynthesis
VLTLHDVIPLRLPDTLTRSAAWYWRTVLPRAVARADLVITGSEFSRREICDVFALSPERVVTVPNGVDPRFRRIHDSSTLARVRSRYQLPDRFVLFVGILSPRKNVERLVRVFGALPHSLRDDVHLVLAGPPGWGNASLERAIETSPVAPRIRRLGIVADEDLPALYSLALGAANISHYEGFGLPALEALACETPLLCADTSAFPEVVGDCALLVDPTDDVAIAAGLADLVAGGPELSARARRGVARATAFTWDNAAAATLAAYRSLAVSRA